MRKYFYMGILGFLIVLFASAIPFYSQATGREKIIDEKVKKFLDKTQALAICGYKNEVDWVPSTAFELLVLSLMQDNEFSGRGIASIKSNLE
jgi:hypothetical protein